jgi:hypothetical protein
LRRTAPADARRSATRYSASRCWCCCSPSESSGRCVDGEDLLVSTFFQPMKGQRESMAPPDGCVPRGHQAARGELLDPTSARYVLLGGEPAQTARVRVCSAMARQTRPRASARSRASTPHCSPRCSSAPPWGGGHRPAPALSARHPLRLGVESRGGRAAHGRWAGLAAARRSASESGRACLLEVSIPVLAGTNDERMFRGTPPLRAQMFEVLTAVRSVRKTWRAETR